MTDNLHNIELDDLVYSYPDDRIPGFQTEISSKEEFRQLASSISEDVPNRGEFFKHQLLIHRYMLIYDRLLLIHRTGTGKTCAAGGTSEMFKKALINATADFINIYIKRNRELACLNCSKFLGQIGKVCNIVGE